jgi:hypothetical protein
VPRRFHCGPLHGFDELSDREQADVFKFTIAFCAICGLLAYLFVDWKLYQISNKQKSEPIARKTKKDRGYDRIINIRRSPFRRCLRFYWLL